MAAPVFDTWVGSTSISAQTDTLPLSWSHTVGVGSDNCMIVAVVNSNNGTSNAFLPTGTPTASVGATPLTWLGYMQMGNPTYMGFIGVWAALNVPTGAQTISLSISCPGLSNGTAYGVSATYTGVGSFGNLQTTFGSTATPSVSVASETGNLVWGISGHWWNDALSGFSLTSRQYQSGTLPYFIGGDGAGASSVAVSATQANAREWAAVGLDLRPVGWVPPPIVPGSFFSLV